MPEPFLNSKTQWWMIQLPLDIISGPELLRQWSLELFGTERPSEAQIQSIADHTQSLWSKFNTLRTELERDYMSIDKYLQAYIASFFIPNIERTRKILLNSRNLHQLEKIIARDIIHVLDFGSGPLSATVGLLVVLGELRNRLGVENFKCKEIHICAVERSEKSFKKGLRLLEQSASKDIKLQISRATSIPKDKKFNIIMAANVINELPEKHQKQTALIFAQSLDASSDNIGLIVEPGQEIHSKNLSKIRDFLCNTEELPTLEIVAPCLHKKPCPLSPDSSRNDWCWFKTEFIAPDVLEKIDRKSKIHHSELAFSFIAFTTNERLQNKHVGEVSWALAVSDEMNAGQLSDQDKRFEYFKNNTYPSGIRADNEMLKQLAATGTKTKLCASTGDYLGGLRAADQRNTRLKRGDTVAEIQNFDAVIKER